MSLTLIDSHVHFWNPDTFTLAWLDDVPVLKRSFLPDDLRQEAGDITIEKLVFVQADVAPDEGLREVEWVSSLAESAPEVAGIVAYAPLEQGDSVRAYLEQLREYPLVKGVRRLIQSEALGFARQADFITGVRRLADFDLTFDICVYHTQLEDVLALVAQCPDVRFVLDHIGKPNIKDGVRHSWQAHITELAAHENVYCKLSGMVTEADHAQWARDDLTPYIEHVIKSFGIQRVMFGSDWPVMKLASDYQQWVAVLQAILSGDEQQAVFSQNAAVFYDL